MSDANSMVDTLVFPMNPTSADWAHFQCWNEAEKSTAIEAYGFTADQLSVFQSIQFKTDDYTIESLAFAMFFDKLLGMKAELFDFYEGAATLIAQGTDTSIFHFEVLKDDFESMPGLDSARAGVSRTRWLMVSDNVEPIANDTDDECAFHFDEWITFRNPQAVSTMSSANEIAISPDENGHFACDESEGCMHGDSTWYPPQCEFPANACTVLLQFLPEHDSENRKFITENNLLIVIKYMGSALSSSGRANFKTFHEGPFTVIFQMRSIDSQSHIFGWTQIPLPPDKDISGEAGSFRLRPSWLSYTMPHLYILHEWLFVWFGDVDVQHVTNRIIEAIESGLEDSRDLRMRLVCDRLKEGGIGLMIMAQALSQSENITPVNCDGISDEALEFVVSKSHQELLFGPATDAAYYSQVDGIQFGVTAVYAKMFCIVEHGKDQDGGLYTFGYILSAFAAVFLCATALYTFKWRKEKIIMASSVKMLGVIFIGAAINLSYILFPRYDQLSHCYLRKYVLQIGIALMFAALEAKTRRLHVIQQSIKQLKRVKITDRDLILRVSGMTLFAVVYLTVLVLVRPIEIRQRVINRERMLICEWNETAETMYKLLFAFIVVALFMIGRISWSLRATNKLYNELSNLRNISTPSL